MTWHGNSMSLVITLCLLTVFIILSDIGTVNLEDKFFEISSAQVFNNTGSGFRITQQNLLY